MTDLPRAFTKPRLRPTEASEYLDLAYGITVQVSTLKFWRCRRPGYGPPFGHNGRGVVYRRLALDAWAQERLREAPRSTGGVHA